MEKVKINFSMMIDDLEDTVFESEGLILKDKMHFDDPNHFHYVIEFSNHSVHIDRKGHTIMKLILETDMITNGTLMTEGLTFPFTVRTHHISLTEGLLLVK